MKPSKSYTLDEAEAYRQGWADALAMQAQAYNEAWEGHRAHNEFKKHLVTYGESGERTITVVSDEEFYSGPSDAHYGCGSPNTGGTSVYTSRAGD